MKKYIRPVIEVVSIDTAVTLLSASGGDSNAVGLSSGTSVGTYYHENTESLSKPHNGFSQWSDDADE